MSQFVFKMPDLGEGTVEAEIIAWHTAPGATVAEDQIIAEVDDGQSHAVERYRRR